MPRSDVQAVTRVMPPGRDSDSVHIRRRNEEKDTAGKTRREGEEERRNRNPDRQRDRHVEIIGCMTYDIIE